VSLRQAPDADPPADSHQVSTTAAGGSGPADGSGAAAGTKGTHGPGSPDPPNAVEASGDEGSETAAGATRHRRGRPRRLSLLGEIPVLLALAVVLALVVKAFVVQAYFIPSGSMERTLLIGDRVFVNKLVYRTRSVHRGEIVVFNGETTGFQQAESVVPPPGNALARVARGLQGLVGLGAPGEKDFIKRVVAVGGDTVACCDNAGRTTVNGVALDEPYIYEPAPLTPGPAGRIFGPVTVPKGYLWVMGDHRSASSDSRANGVIPERVVIGRAFVRVWPVSRFGNLPVPGTFSKVHSPARASGAPPGLTTPDDGQSPAGAALLAVPVVLAAGRRLP